jgi:hypothetical protein
MKDIGPVHHFLGIEATHTFKGLYSSRSHYALTILKRARVVNCKPMSTLLEAKTKTPINKHYWKIHTLFVDLLVPYSI